MRSAYDVSGYEAAFRNSSKSGFFKSVVSDFVSL